jgi:hypothetical protein
MVEREGFQVFPERRGYALVLLLGLPLFAIWQTELWHGWNGPTNVTSPDITHQDDPTERMRKRYGLRPILRTEDGHHATQLPAGICGSTVSPLPAAQISSKSRNVGMACLLGQLCSSGSSETVRGQRHTSEYSRPFPSSGGVLYAYGNTSLSNKGLYPAISSANLSVECADPVMMRLTVTQHPLQILEFLIVGEFKREHRLHERTFRIGWIR